MKRQEDSEQRLEAALAKTEAYIDDSGFTGRVLERLPARRVRRRGPLLVGAATLGIAAFVLLPSGAWLGRATLLALSRPWAHVPLLVAVAAVLGTLLWSSVVAARTE